MLQDIKARLTKGRQRFAKSEKGAAAVEFALVATPFFFLLGMIIETGVMMFTEYAIQAGVQKAARLIRTGQAQSSGGMSAANFKTEICKTGVILNCTSKLNVYVDKDITFASLKAKFPAVTSIGPSSSDPVGPTAYNPGGALCAVGVVATYDWNFVFPFMNLHANAGGSTKRRLAGVLIFANEPFPASTSAFPSC